MMLTPSVTELLRPAGPTYRWPISVHSETQTGKGPTTAQAAHFALMSAEQETDHTTQHVPAWGFNHGSVSPNPQPSLSGFSRSN